MDTSGRVSLRSFHLQAISLCSMRRWKLRSLDIKVAFLRADGFYRDVFIQATAAWEPLRSDRVWELRAPAFGQGDFPMAFRRLLTRHTSNSGPSTKRVVMLRRASTFEPCLFFISRNTGHVVGAFATQIDGILACGRADVLPKFRDYV